MVDFELDLDFIHDECHAGKAEITLRCDSKTKK